VVDPLQTRLFPTSYHAELDRCWSNSTMNIRWKNWASHVTPFKVTQRHRKCCGSIRYRDICWNRRIFLNPSFWRPGEGSPWNCVMAE